MFASGLVCDGVDSEVNADNAAKGDCIGNNVDGVSGVVKALDACDAVPVVRVSGATFNPLPDITVACCVVDDGVGPVLWLNVAVASVAKVSSTLES